MDSYKLPLIFIWVFTIVASIVVALEESQSQVCSIEGIDLGLCLNQRNSSLLSIDGACCKVLNKAVRAGYSCLCLLIASWFPPLPGPISLPLSNCFIHVPPLTRCKVVAPMPIMFPPNDTSVSPPHKMHFPLNSTGKHTSTTLTTRPISGDDADDTTVPPPNVVQVFSNSSRGNSTVTAATQTVYRQITSTKSTGSQLEIETSKGGDQKKLTSPIIFFLFLFLALLFCLILA